MLLGRSVRPPLLLEEGTIMTDVVNMRRESIDLKALLLSRTYLYTLFHKLFGGTPDAAVVACVLSETTRDVVEEYAGDDPSMKGLGRFLENLGECVDGAVLTEQARDEYTRLFIGPGELPASRWNRPTARRMRPSSRRTPWPCAPSFASTGFSLRVSCAFPDDHIATMRGFMAHEAERSLAELRAGNVGDLAVSLRGEEAFVRDHMLTWVDDFARCARRSKTAVLYPQMIEALAAFVRNDAVLLSEAACWAEEARDVCGEMIPGGLGALPGSPEAAAFAEVSDALAALARLHPFGIEDHELVSISV